MHRRYTQKTKMSDLANHAGQGPILPVELSLQRPDGYYLKGPD